jgi:hypothetical protein
MMLFRPAQLDALQPARSRDACQNEVGGAPTGPRKILVGALVLAKVDQEVLPGKVLRGGLDKAPTFQTIGRSSAPAALLTASLPEVLRLTDAAGKSGQCSPGLSGCRPGRTLTDVSQKGCRQLQRGRRRRFIELGRRDSDG